MWTRPGAASRRWPQRIDSGETTDALMDDHDISREDIEQAIVYEPAA
jgi:hypothetical protein